MKNVLSYYPDYDSQRGVHLKTTREKIRYLEGRINKILINPIEEIFTIRKNNEIIWNLNLGIFTLICEGISGLSTYYYKGFQKGRGEQFKNFMKDFMYKSDKTKQEYIDKIWFKFRRSLPHGFFIEGGCIETNPSEHFHYQKKHDKLTIDLETFFTEFKDSFKEFISILNEGKDSTLISFFEYRFNITFPEII